MISLMCGIMTQKNLSTKQKETHRHRERNRLVVAKGEGLGKEWIGSFGLADANYYIYILYIYNIYMINIYIIESLCCMPETNTL